MRTHRLAAVVFALFIATSLSAAPMTLTFGVVEATDAAAKSAFAGILKHINSTPDFHFTLKSYPTFAELYAAFKQGKVDVGYFGAVKYTEAHDEIGAFPIATDGTTQTVIFAAAGSPIKSVSQLKGKKFAFGYEDSTSTHLMPILLLSKHQLTPNDLAERGFLGAQQDVIVDAVLSGRYDAGAVVTSVYERQKAKLTALETSETFPGAPVVLHKGTDPRLVAQLRKLFVSYKAEGDEVKQRFGRGVVAADDTAFNKVRFLVKVVYKKTYH